jgi:quercetin dioxygenase-like cupin family protein
MDRPTLIGPDAFHRPAAETPGVDRREAFADDHVWAGRSRTEGGTWSGWHVHPGHDTYVFQTEGRLRLEFGLGGTESVEGGPGDFVLIPKGVVHRGDAPAEYQAHRLSAQLLDVDLQASKGQQLIHPHHITAVHPHDWSSSDG